MGTLQAGSRLDVSQALRPAVRAIGLARMVRGAATGFVLGVFVGACLLLASHLIAFDRAVPAAFACAVLGLLAGVAWGISRWPREPEAARAADLYFGLDDRLTTAFELRDQATPVAEAQSRDTAEHISGLALHHSHGRLFQKRDAVGLVAVVLFAAGLALGSPARAHQAAGSATGTVDTQKVKRAAVHRLARLQSRVHLGLTHGEKETAAMRKLDRALSRLRRQLTRAPSRRSALRAISATQQQLRHLAASLHPINSHAVAQLNGSLARYLSRRPGSGKNGKSAQSPAAMARALNRLSQTLAHLTPAQRAALARALGRAANSTSSNRLRSLLRQAAFSLANGHPQAARSALQRAARTLSRSAASSAAGSRAQRAASQLGSLKNALSGSGRPSSSGRQARLAGGSQSPSGKKGTAGNNGQNPGRNGPTAGQNPAAGKGQGKGKGTGLGKANGQGTRPGAGNRPGLGTRSGRGQGRGPGRGSGAARTASSRAGTGGTGAHGRGGRGRPATTRSGHTVTVYDPGKAGSGREIVRNGPNGAPEAGALVPYQQVLGQYSRQAHQALDRGSLPPSVQRYVHQYFSTISH
jgi:hypothetical protein